MDDQRSVRVWDINGVLVHDTLDAIDKIETTHGTDAMLDAALASCIVAMASAGISQTTFIAHACALWQPVSRVTVDAMARRVGYHGTSRGAA